MQNKNINSSVVDALFFASQKHAKQRRKSDDSPYINHLIETVSLLVNIGGIGEVDVLVAAALHDILEDTDVSEEQLYNLYEQDVVDLVKAVTDDKSLSLTDRRRICLEKLAEAKNKVKLIKLADIVSNISAVPYKWEDNRISQYFDWTDKIAELCKDASSELYLEYVQRRSLSYPNFPFMHFDDFD